MNNLPSIVYPLVKVQQKKKKTPDYKKFRNNRKTYKDFQELMYISLFLLRLSWISYNKIKRVIMNAKVYLLFLIVAARTQVNGKLAELNYIHKILQLISFLFINTSSFRLKVLCLFVKFQNFRHQLRERIYERSFWWLPPWLWILRSTTVQQYRWCINIYNLFYDP